MTDETANERNLHQVLAVYTWLQSDEGQTMVARTLRYRGLPAALDSDLEARVLQSAAQATALGKTIESPAAWSTNCLRLRSIDLLRASMTQRAATTRRGHSAGDPLLEQTDSVGDQRADEVARQLEVSLALDDIRRRLVRHGTPAWQISAALTVVAVGVDDAEPGHDCPQPSGGAGDREMALWAGLWYAGQRTCFDDDSVAVRKRRSRASTAVATVLAEAGRAAGLGEDAGSA